MWLPGTPPDGGVHLGGRRGASGGPRGEGRASARAPLASPTMQRVLALAALSVLTALGTGLACSSGEDRPGEGFTREDLERRVRELYDRAREAGDEVPADVVEWAQQDVARIGDWEYRVLRLEDGGDAALEERLGELGEERWQVFWLERRGDAYRVFLKRPARSYLQRVPLSDLRRLVPSGGGAG